MCVVVVCVLVGVALWWLIKATILKVLPLHKTSFVSICFLISELIKKSINLILNPL